MNLEGHKFYFARDDEGRIYAEYEMETDTANREGWLLPPLKGEHKTEYYEVCGSKQMAITWETTGKLVDNYPEFVIANLLLEGDVVPIVHAETAKDSLGDPLRKIVVDFAILMRSIYLNSKCTARKIMTAIDEFVGTGACISNSDEDSVCGDTCDTCRRE